MTFEISGVLRTQTVKRTCEGPKEAADLAQRWTRSGLQAVRIHYDGRETDPPEFCRRFGLA